MPEDIIDCLLIGMINDEDIINFVNQLDRVNKQYKLKPERCFDRIRDVFGVGNVMVGGSYARKIALKDTGASCGDIDFYINNPKMCRYIIRDILENVIFKELEIVFTTGEDSKTPGNPDYYKMDGIRKRLSIEFPNAEYPPMDFIFVQVPQTCSMETWFMVAQASTISEVGLELNFSNKGYTKRRTMNFIDALESRTAPVRINSDEKRCTKAHLDKVIAYCKANNLEYKII